MLLTNLLCPVIKKSSDVHNQTSNWHSLPRSNSTRGPAWMTSAVPLPLHPSEGRPSQTRTSSASSCALRPNEWTSSASPCPLLQTLQPGPAPTERSTKGTVFVFFNLMKVWTELWPTSGVVSPDESLVSPSICPFGHNKALSALYVVYSMEKNNLKLTNKDFVSHNLHNTNKLSVVSGISIFIFYHCVSWFCNPTTFISPYVYFSIHDYSYVCIYCAFYDCFDC